MSSPQVFLAYRFLTLEETVASYRGGLQVDGRVTYSVGPAVNFAYIAEWKHWDKRSFMFGLLVDVASKQEVDVEYRDTRGSWFSLDKENVPGGKHKIVDQLGTDPGTPAGKRWVGFSQPMGNDWALDDSKISQGEMEFDVRVRIYPSAGPEFIPFAGRHLRDKAVAGSFTPGTFAAGHMPSSWFVPQLRATATDGKHYVSGPRGRRAV